MGGRSERATSSVPLVRGSRTRKHFKHGTHRAVEPRETLARFESLLPETGVTRLADITGLDRVGVPVVTAVRPNSRYVSVAHGKGVTLVDARASAMMEAIERHHAEEPRLETAFISYEEISTDRRTVDLHDLSPAPEGPPGIGQVLHWVAGRGLDDGEETWLPMDVVAHCPTEPALFDSGGFRTGTTGLASGNTLDEAMVHALCEVIERDARTLWSFETDAHRGATRIDPDSVEDDRGRSLLEAIRDARLAVALYDATSDVGVATIVAHLIETDPGTRVPYARAQGGGTHPCRDVAVTRALTEALQARLVLIEGAREDLEHEDYALPDPRVLERSRERVLHGEAPRRLQDLPSRDSDFFADDLQWMLGNLQRVGLGPPIVVDLTRGDIGVPVVRVVVPGMEDAELVEHYVIGPRLAQVLEGRVQRRAP